MKKLLLLIVVLSIPNATLAGDLQVCVKGGKVIAKSKCAKGEIVLTAKGISALSNIGPQGPQGPKGDMGPQGPAGESSADIIPSGQTVTGTISGSGKSFVAVPVSFPGLLPGNGITRDDIIFVDTTPLNCNACPSGGNCTPCFESSFLVNQNLCTGSVNNPIAPAGKVCIYFKKAEYVSNLYALPASKWGFSLVWDFQPYWVGFGYTADVAATWAYKAP